MLSILCMTIHFDWYRIFSFFFASGTYSLIVMLIKCGFNYFGGAIFFNFLSGR